MAVGAENVALTGVTLIDGTGGPVQRGRTVVIEGNRITAVGPDGQVPIPAGAEVMELAGHTVIPGMVGLHNHLYYTAAGGRAAQLTYSAPRLYLGSGVTTVRTTGSRQPYAEINLREEIEAGRAPGPRIHITAPYITGGGGISGMTMLELARAGAPLRALLGRRGGDVAEGVHAHQQRGAGRRDRRGPQSGDQGHRPHLFGQLHGGRRAGDRQHRARPADEQRLQLPAGTRTSARPTS